MPTPVQRTSMPTPVQRTSMPTPVQITSMPTINKINIIETYHGKEIYRWNNYFIGGERTVVSISLDNIKKWIDYSSSHADNLGNLDKNYYNIDYSSMETYKSFRLVKIEFYSDYTKKNLTFLLWFSEENNSDFMFSFEKETLVFIIDNKDSLISALKDSR